MEIGIYEKEVEDKEIREIAERILPDTSFGKIYRICEITTRRGDFQNEKDLQN